MNNARDKQKPVAAHTLPVQPPWYTLPHDASIKPEHNSDSTQVVVVGCGLAGCHTAYELAKHGVKVLLVDAGESLASGASGNNAGIVKPFVTRDYGLTDQFYQVAFNYLLNLFSTEPDLRRAAQFNQCGVLQLVEHPYPASEQYRACTPEQCTAIAGTRIDSAALFFNKAGWLNPAALCNALVTHPNIKVQLNCKLKQITQTSHGWELDLDKRVHCATLILANGNGLNKFSQTDALPITPARGQCSHFQLQQPDPLKTVVSGKRYALPVNDGIMIGASFERGVSDTQPTQQDKDQNFASLSTLLPELESLIETASLEDQRLLANKEFCAIRATTPDRLPIVGPVPDFEFYSHAFALIKNGLPESRFENARYHKGLYAIGGFGSRGIVSAPYCAKLLVDFLVKQPEEHSHNQAFANRPLENWSALLHPARFAIRQLRRSSALA